MAEIQQIHSRFVYDSRGNPTVEVELTTKNGLFRAIVPSGASTGSNEAIELRDKDPKKWGGKGVLTAVSNVNNIIGPELIKSGLQVTEQAKIDQFMIDLDGTYNKSKLGANAILGVSLAISRAAASFKEIRLYQYIAELSGQPTSSYILPVPFQNVLNGGSHAGGRLAFQEFMIVPLNFNTFSEALRANSEIYHILKDLAKKKYGPGAGNVGDEGGVAPDLQTAEEALDLIVLSIEKAGYTGKVFIAMDPASSEFYEDKSYNLDYKVEVAKQDKKEVLTGQKMIAKYKDLSEKYPIVLLEDPFAEDDWETWTEGFPTLSNKIGEIVGDDLTVTNLKYIKKAIANKCANGLLLKVNQIGTLTESIQAAKLAFENHWGVFVSHRSGETEDTFIADLTVGLRTGHLKSGAPSRSERLAKYNQLLRIEEELGSKATYAGPKFHTAHEL